MEMLYPDRKMMKWQGFFLSEHQEAFWEESNSPKAFDRDEQNPEKITADLELAWKTHLPVLIQLNERGVNHQLTTLKATVEGYSDTILFIQVDERIESILIDKIRAVSFLNDRKWSQ